MVRAFAGDSTITSRRRPSPLEPPALAPFAVDPVLAATLVILTSPPDALEATAGDQHAGPVQGARTLLPLGSTHRGGSRVPRGKAATFFRGPGGTARRAAHNKVMSEYSYLVLYLPRGTPRDVARRILTDHAEYGDWELARLRLNADGSRKATLRRQVIRPVLTLR